MASDDAVPLTELDVITRWSLAVRQPSVDRAELISVLRSDLEFLETAVAPIKKPARKAVAKPASANTASANTAPAKTVPAKTAQRRSAGR